MVKGKAGHRRKYVTPGPQHSNYVLRSTWQLNEQDGTWQCKEFKKKWKLLHDPHTYFQGSKVRALQVFHQAEQLKVARIANRGTLLVDTGACSSVCRPEAFKTATLNREATEELYTVDDTPRKACGEIRPKLRLGDYQQEEAEVTFQVVQGINEDILSVNRALDIGAAVHFETDTCYIQWADGNRATFNREGRQFLLPFEELGSCQTWHPKVAHIDPSDEEALAVQAYAMQVDEEAEAVQEYADEEAEAARAKELEQEDPGLLADLEEDDTNEEAPAEPQALAQPVGPTEAERDSHRLTHLPFQPWCEECVSGKAKSDQRRRDQSTAKEGVGVIQMDYFFLSPDKEEEVEDESRLVTILCMTDTVTGWPLALQLPNKSREVAQSRYCLQNVDLYLKNLGYEKIILQQDGEPSIRAFARSIQQYCGAAKISVREAPPKQHQAQGAVESMNGFVASQIRALWLDVRKRYPEVDVSHNITPWLVRHASWLIARFHVRSRDGMTPYRLVMGGDYKHPVAMLGEVVLGKVPTPRGKMQRRWVKGIWLGKLDRNDTNVIGTSSGAIAVRSIRRLPKEEQVNAAFMKDLKGIPWQPRDGVRHRITREMSQPVALPPPAAAAGPSAQDEQDQEHPALAIDGSKVDEDAAVVQGVAQLEELGVINDEDDIEPEDAAGVPAEGDDYSPSIAPPASPPPLSGARGSSPPYRGAGWSSGMQSLPDSPMSPSGLGEGGKRKEAETTHSTAGEAEPKQSRQCGVLRHLTNKEVWERIQEWGNSEEASNPTALQRVSNVTDFVDQMLDPEKVTEARKAQLAKSCGTVEPSPRFTRRRSPEVLRYSRTNGSTNVPKGHTNLASLVPTSVQDIPWR